MEPSVLKESAHTYVNVPTDTKEQTVKQVSKYLRVGGSDHYFIVWESKPHSDQFLIYWFGEKYLSSLCLEN